MSEGSTVYCLLSTIYYLLSLYTAYFNCLLSTLKFSLLPYHSTEVTDNGRQVCSCRVI